ncbi:MAG: PBP1A family penicillin-binding protein [Lachnospiraceae bacterium]|nr:PBP1A family penicillin-binding protein [Lachnospiraceae bacterium]
MAGRKKHPVLRVFGLLFVLGILTAGAIAAAFYFRYGDSVKVMYEEAEGFVRSSTENTFKLSQTSTVYAADGSIISRLKGTKDTTYVEYEDLPLEVCSAIVSIEDKRFYRHDGVDYIALVRALKAMIETGELSQGGSTITMQLARNIFLNQDKNWRRKVEEIFIAWELEKQYEKEDLLEFYLNNIYFGNGYYGIGAASRGYFNKRVEQLSLSQIAFLCAIPNNPTLYDPLTNMENTLARRNRILKNMLNDGKILELDYATAIIEEIILERPAAIAKNDYVETFAYYCATRALMKQEGFVFQYKFASDYEEEIYNQNYIQAYDACEARLRSQGYQIETSLNLKTQEQLQAAVDEALVEYTEVNDEGVFKLQSSAVCINNDTGLVEAIVGGRSQEFAFYSLNRAYQSYRQPGSAIKPLIVYTPMLERGYTAETIVVDEEIEGGPKNANGTHLGEITLQTAVEKSVNVIAWKLFEELTPKKGLGYLERMNFSHINTKDYQLPSALGGFTEGVSALEMAAAYAALENDGVYREPTCIERITDPAGNVIFEADSVGEQVYQHNAARAMTAILTGVMENGTASELGLSQMPSAGKTGTTNDQKDGWFVGYTRYYTTSVWVGYDLPKKLEDLKGNTYPGQIWQQFMEELHVGLPIKDFKTAVQIKDENKVQGFTPDEDETEEITETELPEQEDEKMEEIFLESGE